MMIKYMVKDLAIAKSLTGKPGDVANGRKLAINRKQGNCLACHVMPIPEQPYHGKIGPELNGVASRLSEGEIRLRIVNPKSPIPTPSCRRFTKKTDFTVY